MGRAEALDVVPYSERCIKEVACIHEAPIEMKFIFTPKQGGYLEKTWGGYYYAPLKFIHWYLKYHTIYTSPNKRKPL